VIYIEQPAFLPWLGFCEALIRCDVVALLDDVQFTQRGWQNRNRIKTPNGVQWLTVPVTASLRTYVRDVRVSRDFDGRRICGRLHHAYARASHHDEVLAAIDHTLSKRHDWLVDLNHELLEVIRAAFGSKAMIIRTSELARRESRDKVERISNICHALDDCDLWAGMGTSGYVTAAQLAALGVSVTWNKFAGRHPTYAQVWPRQGFIPGLSVVDAACSLGFAGTAAMLRASLDAFVEADSMPGT
jgi:WbqC-like protein